MARVVAVMSASQRRKGHDWERATAQLFRGAMPGAAIKRGGDGTRRDVAADVQVPFFWLECKCGARPNAEAALVQAEGACNDPTLWPVAVVKRDRREPYVALRLDDFLEIVAAWYLETK
jgi:hypothetical protein